jgi:hypothetical protein
MSRNYRALPKRGSGPSGGTALHLIREGSEASLCGIPRSSLGSGGIIDELMCPECIESLSKPVKPSAPFKTVEQP